jgi:hypothetical protein
MRDVRFLRGVWHKLRTLKPGKVVIEPADEREIGLVNAWLANGAPADLTTSKETEEPHGKLFRVDMKAKRLESAESIAIPGLYLEKQGVGS